MEEEKDTKEEIHWSIAVICAIVVLFIAAFLGFVAPIRVLINGGTTLGIINGVIAVAFLSPLMCVAMGFALSFLMDAFGELREGIKEARNTR